MPPYRDCMAVGASGGAMPYQFPLPENAGAPAHGEPYGIGLKAQRYSHSRRVLGYCCLESFVAQDQPPRARYVDNYEHVLEVSDSR